MDNLKVLQDIEAKEKTKFIEKSLFALYPVTLDDDFIDKFLDATQTVVELDARKAFLEGTAAVLGLDSPDDTGNMLQQVKIRYAERGIELKRSVQNWFSKPDIVPSTDPAYRRNLYEFCLAMGMGYQETTEFFLKAFLTVPFNYKNREEAVYFYSMKMGKSYREIVEVQKIVDSFPAVNPDSQNTQQIREDILSITEDSDFLEYLRIHCFDKQHQYETARKEIIRLVEANKAIAPEKLYSIGPQKRGRSKEYNRYKNIGVQSTGTLLYDILGFRYQSLTKEEKNCLKNNRLPTFPRDGDIDVIMSGADISPNILRKVLILMQFYNFYWGLLLNIYNNKRETEIPVEQINEQLYDFNDETNNLLERCGFEQIYIRNPYDWIILFCANSAQPIDNLQLFMEKRYLGEE